MTGNELNYAFQQTVSSEYTFGSGDKLIDSFPSWPSMKEKTFFNPYKKVNVFYYNGDDFKPGTSNLSIIRNQGYDVSFGNLNDYVTLTFGICISSDAHILESLFYYNDETYNLSHVSFNVNIIYKDVQTLYTLDLEGGDFIDVHDKTHMIYKKLKNWRCDGNKHRLYYDPKNYMTLHTSDGDVILDNNNTQLYILE